MEVDERNKLVMDNKKLILKCVNEVYPSVNKRVEYEDLEQAGYLVAIEIIDKYFKPELGYKLSTYLYTNLKRNLRKHVKDITETIRIPEQARNKYAQVNIMINEDGYTKGEALQKAKMSERVYNDVYAAYGADRFRLETEVGKSLYKEGKQQGELKEVFNLNTNPLPFEEVIYEDIWKEELIKEINKKFKGDQRYVVVLENMIKNGRLKACEVEPQFTVTRQRIQQIGDKIKTYLKHEYESIGI